MPQTSCQTLTLEGFLQRSETKPASEYTDGRVLQKPMPQGKHSILQIELASSINRLLRPSRIACAFPELQCTFGSASIVPDIAVFAWDRVPNDGNREIINIFSAFPDWTIEILSPGQSHTRVTKNILHCLKFGSALGWLIDPAEKTVLIYRPLQEIAIYDHPEAGLPVPSFANALQLTVKDLFRWLLK